MLEYFASTVDNPFNPFTQYEDWNRFDEDHNYFTNQKIARLLENEATDLDPIQEILIYNKAVDRLIAVDFMGNYKRIARQVDLDAILKSFDE